MLSKMYDLSSEKLLESQQDGSNVLAITTDDLGSIPDSHGGRKD